jgi:hypothetical protein
MNGGATHPNTPLLDASTIDAGALIPIKGGFRESAKDAPVPPAIAARLDVSFALNCVTRRV